MYDQGQIIHPACFGHMICQTNGGSAALHPALGGYSLERKPLVDPKSRKLLFLLVEDEKLRMICQICTVGKKGPSS
jgi:hypothetical protein